MQNWKVLLTETITGEIQCTKKTETEIRNDTENWVDKLKRNCWNVNWIITM